MTWSYRFVHERVENGDGFEEGVHLAKVYWVDGKEGVKAYGWVQARVVKSTADEVAATVEKAINDARAYPPVQSWEIGHDEG
jgi:hypothetical protein